MEQLTLFGGQVQERRAAKVGRRHGRKGTHNAQRWDLWNQECEPERELVLFFLDIRNFTPLTMKHHAGKVIHIVTKLFSKFQNIIRNNHGQIIETSGDGFYAAFGLKRGLPDAVNEAVQSGLAILQTLQRLNESSFAQELRQRIEVGIGVHAGKVATGNLIVGGKDHFVVMGYPVNVASRIQAATKEFNNNFIVSASVFAQVNKPLPHAERVTASLKGVEETVELYLIGTRYEDEAEEYRSVSSGAARDRRHLKVA